MRNPKQLILPILLFVILIAYIFRNHFLYAIQLAFIRSIEKHANVSNQAYQKKSLFPDHAIYTLKGTEKLFPHRVNSLQRLDFLYKNFKGFECDIHFDKNKKILFVTHDGIKNDDISLTEFLKLDKYKKIFWLDVKNLHTDNIDAFYEALENLDFKFSIKNRFIIECTNKAIVHQVAKRGYFTSYYVQPNLKDSTIYNDLDDVCSGDTSAIAVFSHDILYHDDRLSLCRKKKRLIWDLNFWHSVSKNALLKNANDTTVLICLINIKSPGYK